MKRLSLLLAVVLVLSLSAFSAQHIVRFANGIPTNFAARVNALGGTVVTQHPLLAVVEGLSPEAAATLRGSFGVSEVNTDAEFTLDASTGETTQADSTPTSVSNPATAFFYPRQWHMRAIGTPYAWAAGRLGSPNVTVAIIDSGIDYTYPDLNGLIDLSRSVSFQPAEDAVVAATFPGKNPVTDIYFHGTHVAHTVASKAAVAAGVTSKVTLIGVKVLAYKPSTGSASGLLSAVLNGILWAADHDADVANMSLGGGFSKVAAGPYVSLINSVFAYAYRKGMLIVVSAGNEASDLDHNGNYYSTYCSSPHVVCVAATGPTSSAGTNGPWVNVDAAAYYTNFGRSAIDIAAPGGNTGGYVYQGCSQTSVYLPVCRTGTYVIGSMGTSMASPLVSGLAALLVEDIGKDKPSEVKARLLQSADDLGQPGTDPYYGKGRINVPHAIGISY
ncbi:MAG TPA: S8 family serine peptidase [Clostridia bacterium]|nr:S8 family serine peptidase [Clostridia bacterium]